MTPGKLFNLYDVDLAMINLLFLRRVERVMGMREGHGFLFILINEVIANHKGIFNTLTNSRRVGK